MKIPVTHPRLGSFIDDGSLKLIEVLGVGGYGVVYRALETCALAPKSYAIKCLLRTRPSGKRQSHIHEVTLHQISSAHPGVVTLHRVIEDHDYIYIVMDYAPDHDLFTQILDHCRYIGHSDLIKRVFLQLLDAVAYCHSLGIYHRDLKPENILCFDEGSRVAITDFGLATTEVSSGELHTGSTHHMSPECQDASFSPGGTYSPISNDIWSLGIILINLITGRNPWKTATLDDPIFREYLRSPMLFFLSALPISLEFNRILVRMLHVDWRKRVTLSEVCKMIEKIDDFYSSDVIFEGILALCPWETRLEAKDVMHKDHAQLDASNRGLKSCWSDDSVVELNVGHVNELLVDKLSPNTSWTMSGSAPELTCVGKYLEGVTAEESSCSPNSLYSPRSSFTLISSRIGESLRDLWQSKTLPNITEDHCLGVVSQSSSISWTELTDEEDPYLSSSTFLGSPVSSSYSTLHQGSEGRNVHLAWRHPKSTSSTSTNDSGSDKGISVIRPPTFRPRRFTSPRSFAHFFRTKTSEYTSRSLRD